MRIETLELLMLRLSIRAEAATCDGLNRRYVELKSMHLSIFRAKFPTRASFKFVFSRSTPNIR